MYMYVFVYMYVCMYVCACMCVCMFTVISHSGEGTHDRAVSDRHAIDNPHPMPHPHIRADAHDPLALLHYGLRGPLGSAVGIIQ
ncbi:hypothetical protein B484DRAFT_274667 [Ochromonadaceae sp. CCMP2298]|nr:hypothetical protein B484DRAFT_274667 [Ochromonadaceae sp. CCMP2298]